MKVRFVCQCGKKLRAAERLIGKSFTCPRCNTEIMVPADKPLEPTNLSMPALATPAAPTAPATEASNPAAEASKPAAVASKPRPAQAPRRMALALAAVLLLVGITGAGWYFDLHHRIWPLSSPEQAELPDAPVEGEVSPVEGEVSPVDRKMAEKLIEERLMASLKLAEFIESLPDRKSMAVRRAEYEQLCKEKVKLMEDFEKLPAPVREAATKTYATQLIEADIRMLKAKRSVPTTAKEVGFRKVEMKKTVEKEKSAAAGN